MRKLFLAAAALCLIAGCGGPAETQTPFNPSPDTPVSVPTTEAPLPAGEHLSIPSIGVDTDLVPLGLTADGEHEVPPKERPLDAGWYEPGPEPGQVGPAIILGHINSSGKDGIFVRLHELKVGDEITAGGTTFKVYSVRQVPKNAFPKQYVYGETKAPELRLITCGGAFDDGTGHYKDNWIVWAA